MSQRNIILAVVAIIVIVLLVWYFGAAGTGPEVAEPVDGAAEVPADDAGAAADEEPAAETEPAGN